MSDLNAWEFSKKVKFEEDGKEYERDVKVHIFPSTDKNYNWETVIGRNRLRFKTKKSARKNLNRIIG